MPPSRLFFLNLGHSVDHLFMLLFPAVAALAAASLGSDYSTLLPLATGSFIAFGAFSLPAGWLADRWSRERMMTIFFIGIGASAVLTGMTQSYWQIAASLTLLGMFAAIYHPVGLAMVAQGGGDVGRRIGVNGVWGNMGVAVSALSIGAFADFAGWRAAFILLGLASIGVGLAWIKVERATRPDAAAQARAKIKGTPSPDWRRILAVIAVSTAIGGFIFNIMTVSLPKVLGDRLVSFQFTATEVGAIASMVYATAAFTQVAVGRAIDKWAVKPLFLALAAGQVVSLYLSVSLVGWPMIVLAVVVMALVFGQIPINDTLIARHTPDHWRSRVYAVKYVLSFTVAGGAVRAISWLYKNGGGFPSMYTIAAVGAMVITAAGACLPGRRPAPAAVPAE